MFECVGEEEELSEVEELGVFVLNAVPERTALELIDAVTETVGEFDREDVAQDEIEVVAVLVAVDDDDCEFDRVKVDDNV